MKRTLVIAAIAVAIATGCAHAPRVIEDTEAIDEELTNAQIEREYLGAEWIAYRDSLLNAQWEKRHKGGK